VPPSSRHLTTTMRHRHAPAPATASSSLSSPHHRMVIFMLSPLVSSHPTPLSSPRCLTIAT
jgi:hypothetical protein